MRVRCKDHDSMYCMATDKCRTETSGNYKDDPPVKTVVECGGQTAIIVTSKG